MKNNHNRTIESARGEDVTLAGVYQCSTCRYWRETDDDLGICRRYAPRPFVSPNAEEQGGWIAHWPLVLNTNWCGEWQ